MEAALRTNILFKHKTEITWNATRVRELKKRLWKTSSRAGDEVKLQPKICNWILVHFCIGLFQFMILHHEDPRLMA